MAQSAHPSQRRYGKSLDAAVIALSAKSITQLEVSRRLGVPASAINDRVKRLGLRGSFKSFTDASEEAHLRAAQRHLAQWRDANRRHRPSARRIIERVARLALTAAVVPVLHRNGLTLDDIARATGISPARSVALIRSEAGPC